MMKAMCPAGWLAMFLAGAVFCLATPGRAADSTAPANANDPLLELLDLLNQKGFVNQKEAKMLQDEVAAYHTNNTQWPQMPPESKWKISEGLKDVELFGDVQLRYEDRSAADAVGNQIDLQRFRYAVRVGLRGDLFDQFYYGLRLDTGVNPRSPFVTLGSSSGFGANQPNSGTYQGPFGKSNGGLNIGQAYLGWHPWDWLELTAGKMPNPLYTTSLLWSGNISPEGFAERLKYNVGPAEFFTTFGQFLYADFNPSLASGGFGINSQFGQKTDNIFMFAWQGGIDYHITTNIWAKAAGTLYTYTGRQPSPANTMSSFAPYFGDPYIGEGGYYLGLFNAAPGYSGYGYPNLPPSLPGYGSVNYPLNQVGLNHLTVVEIPFELDFKVSRLDARVFGDFAYNLEGSQRAKDAANAYQAVQAYYKNNLYNVSPHLTSPQTSDVKAYQFGFDVGSRNSLGLVNGSVSKRHSWEVKTYWQHVEQYALDPNLLDLDFFNGVENLQGIYVAGAYGLTDNLIATFRYGHASRINNLLGTGGTSGDIPQINPINDFDIYQVDLTFRF